MPPSPLWREGWLGQREVYVSAPGTREADWTLGTHPTSFGCVLGEGGSLSIASTFVHPDDAWYLLLLFGPFPLHAPPLPQLGEESPCALRTLHFTCGEAQREGSDAPK